jgi:2-keto-3-deoxy-L-rhamnonate aldolase RhmA
MNDGAVLKARLGTGRPALGCWLHLFSPLAAETWNTAPAVLWTESP